MGGREDIVVSPLVQVLLEKLASSMLENFGSIWKIGNEMRELSNELNNIQAILCITEQRQLKDPIVKCCMESLRIVAYSTEDLLDEFIYEVRRQELANERDPIGMSRRVRQHFSFTFNGKQIFHEDELAALINEIKEKLVDIEKRLRLHCVVGVGSLDDEMGRKLRIIQQRNTRQKSSSLVDESNVIGRIEDTNHLKSILLLDQYSYERDVSFVAIVGMGGLGKTTLAQIVYNDLDVQTHFDIKAWVCVSDDFNVEKLTRAILESITRRNFDLMDLEPLQCELRDRIIGKRFLLVLDDAWYENRRNWNILLVPLRVVDKGSRIIVTTRSEKVASSIGRMVQTLKLQILSNEDCWSLFTKLAFLYENPDAYPNLASIGRKIVEKCKGLPLVASTLGDLLRSKLNEEEWHAILESDIWNLEGDEILSSLSLSYHHLPSHLKQCFAYCCLFPKGFEFNKKNLIRLWMAEGFVPSEHVEKMEAIGSQYFDDLLHRSFFQYSTNSKPFYGPKFVMHDLIHDLAQLLCGKICSRLESEKSCDISEKVRHLSLITNNLESIDKELYKCKNLSTFLLHRQGWGLTKGQAPHDLFEELKCLRVLDLAKSNIERLPDSIGNLKCLRYLNLYATNIRELPESICKLYNLQTLLLLHCMRLYELPSDIRNLTKLQHLVVRDLTSMPPGIGRLPCLKTLPLFCVGQHDGHRIGELKELRHLQGALSITGLRNVLNVEEAKEANLKNKQKLNELELLWDYHVRNEGDFERDFEVLEGDFERDFEVLEGLQPHTELKRLMINGYGGSRFPNWMVKDLSSYDKLKIMTLSMCRCKYLPPLGLLPFLQFLKIDNMVNIKHVGHEFYGDEKKGFQSLKLLMFNCMAGFKEWHGSKEGEFPCLEKLIIINCAELQKMPPLLPTVKDVAIQGCVSLTSVSRLPSVSSLTLLHCGDTLLNLSMPLLGETLEELVMCGFQSQERLWEEDVRLQYFPRLKHLEILGWNSLISLPKELHKLISLENLEISNCPELTLFQEEECLPSKLKRLSITECSKLESLPSGLSNLSFLEDLVIDGCDNLTSLPDEGLPMSLRSLNISDRGEALITRCREDDFYKIAHIPNVTLQKTYRPHRLGGWSTENFDMDYWETSVSGSEGDYVLDQFSEIL